MRWSIRYQLLIPLLTLLLCVVVSSAWGALASAQHARQQIETQVRHIVRTLHQSTFPLTEKVLDLMKGFSGADYVLIHPVKGSYTTLGTAVPELPPVTIDSHDWEQLRLEHPTTIHEVKYLSAGVQLEQGQNAGTTVYILYPESLWRDALWESFRPSLLLGGGIGLAASAIAVVLAQRWTRRIQELERRTRLIAGGDFSPMPLPRRNDELRDLSRSINEMAQRLAGFQESMRKSERLRLLGQVSGGLAHQLRNGVTGARLAVQVHTHECPDAATAESLQVALRQLALVELHLKRFLDLGRSGDLERRPCSLHQLVEETVALLTPQCRHARIDLQCGASASSTSLLTVQGDASQLQHLLLNLVSNAIEAAGPGGSVTIQLEALKDRARIIVLDSGPGPMPAVADKLFEPFVTGKREGVGLGLAVARQVAEAHGGTIAWQRLDGHTQFCVELPLEPKA